MIKTEDFMEDDGEREAMGSFINLNSEKKALEALVDAFAEKMKDKLIQQYHADWNGWDDEKYKDNIEKAFTDQVTRENKDYVDIANFAAMLWNFEQEE